MSTRPFIALLSLATLVLPGCAASPSTLSPPAADEPHARAMPPATPALGCSVRVGGNMDVQVTGTDGDFRAGVCRIDTPLPVGYPAPTPPDAIDLKTYPVVRLAQVESSGNPDAGMNQTFWPLFNHIKSHDIAMTSPVEMTFPGLQNPDQPAPQSWSMAFLYRTPDLNRTGVEGRVTVRDSSPVTVVAAGLKGDYSMSLVQRGREQLQQWLAANPQWEPAGEWRALYYNGPTLLWWNKWAEVQLPVRRSDAPTTAHSPASQAPAARSSP